MLLDFMKTIFVNFASAAINLLPDSPFTEYFDIWADLPYIGYINWLFPFGSCVKILAVWDSAIVTFYAVMAILRWIKAVGD